MDIKDSYTPKIVQRYKHLLFSDSTLLNTAEAQIFRSGGCSTRLKLLSTNGVLKHCTSADLHGVVTSDYICEFINSNLDSQTLKDYITTISKQEKTNTEIDNILNLNTVPRSVWIIVSFYKQYINANY